MNTSRVISFVTRATVSITLIVFAFAIVAVLVKTKPQLGVVTGGRSLPAVVVFEAKAIPIRRRTLGYGTAQSQQHADVPAQISSTVVTVPPTTQAGRVVHKGELLVELDDIDFQQQVIRAEQAHAAAVSSQSLLSVERDAADARAELAAQDQVLAEAEFARVQVALNKGAAKQREVDSARQSLIAVSSAAINAQETANRFPAREEQADSTIRSAEADLVIAQENLRRCKVLSPIDGVLQDIDVRVGEHVQSGQRIARVVYSGLLEIPLRLPSYSRSHIHIGDEVALQSTGFGKRVWNARITRIAPEDDAQSRTMIAYVDVDQDPNDARRIPPGLFVRGEVQDASDSTPRWVIPRRSIREDRILVIRDSIIRSMPVKIDFSITGALDTFDLPDHDWAVLETSLAVGDQVVVDPGGSLRDGMSVRVIFAQEVSLE